MQFVDIVSDKGVCPSLECNGWMTGYVDYLVQRHTVTDSPVIQRFAYFFQFSPVVDDYIGMEEFSVRDCMQDFKTILRFLINIDIVIGILCVELFRYLLCHT